MDAAVHRLEGTLNSQKGGLVIMKKDNAEKHVFKKPAAKISLLGLDKLAATKRKLQEDETEQKHSKVLSYKNDWDDSEDIEDTKTLDKDKSQKERFVYDFLL